MKLKHIFFSLALMPTLLSAQETAWPVVNNEMYSGTRWWWLGSAVDKEGLTYNLEEFSKKGIRSVEITPIYGVQNNDENDIPFLSDKWMEMLQYTQTEGKRLGVQIDMNTGTGWPFGGPEVGIEDAASKLLVNEYTVQGGKTIAEKIIPSDKKQVDVANLQRVMAYQGKKILDITDKVDANQQLNYTFPKGEWRVIATFCGKTFQQVKRAAPGGEGYVMDHFSKRAVGNYLTRFDNAFAKSNTPYPHNFFNDSYEVYQADWTEDFYEQFEQRRGYKLENHLPAFLANERTDETARIISDYRETIGEILLENFTQQWTAWAHENGSKTRNQAHGSPGNLIDIYAAVDVPECEGFGLSDFGIKGLRTDSLTRHNDSDLSMLKYASSAAHIAGKPYTSSETFTWLTEHFRTSLSQCKPDMDLMFTAGVNHMYFHGSPYSPKNAEWPGWRFYASINMTPHNSIWHDAEGLNTYINRCQSFLQMGKPDNDFLVYLPVYDMWYEQPGRLLLFSIHDMQKRTPKFINVINSVYKSGYDVDYISDRFILSTQCVDGKFVTSGGAAYEALILPAVHTMPDNVLKHVMSLASQGGKVVFMENFPKDVPGINQLKDRKKSLKESLKGLDEKTDFTKTLVRRFDKGSIITGSDYEKTLQAIGKPAEELITKHGLHIIRRSNNAGYHYFISALTDKNIDEWVTLAVPATSAMLYNPMTGESGKAATIAFMKIDETQKEYTPSNKLQVRIQLKSGESVILKTFTNANVTASDWKYLDKRIKTIELKDNWTLRFEESFPAIDDTFTLSKLGSWTELNNADLKRNMGTGIYETTFDLKSKTKNGEYMLKLGDVRESARVFVNGQEVGIVWAAPFECRIGKYLKEGENHLRIEVTNLPANRIADYDRNKQTWRIFKEINVVNRNYKKDDYGHWKPMPSGLTSPVKIVVYE